MRKWLVLMACILMPLAVLAQDASQADKQAKEAKAFKDKVQELTKDKTDRLDKILAVYNFVRDDVAQIPAKYG